MNKIEYRSDKVKTDLLQSFGADFELVTQKMLSEYGLDGFIIIVCPHMIKDGEEVLYGQPRLRCAATVSKADHFKRIWISVHWCRVDMILTLYHEIHHVLYPSLSEEDIEWLEKEYGRNRLSEYIK